MFVEFERKMEIQIILKCVICLYIVVFISHAANSERKRYFDKVYVASRGVILKEIASINKIKCALLCVDIENCEAYHYDGGICQILTGPEGTGSIPVYKGKEHYANVSKKLMNFMVQIHLLI